MAVRRDRLDTLVCSHEDHDAEGCEGGAMYFHSRCHGDVPTWAIYGDGVVTITCAECEAEIVSFEVAGEPPPRFQRRPA